MTRSAIPLLLASTGLCTLTACGGTATWSAETWGEDYIEAGVPAEAFADGCSATFTQFIVSVGAAELVDADGALVASALSARTTLDLVPVGPHPLGEAEIPAGDYDHARFDISPDGANPSIDVAGSVTCGANTVTFAWTFDTTAVYDCEPATLSLASKGTGVTQFTVHGDHFFYDHLECEDAEVRGEAILAADANGDGEVTRAELAGVSVPELGYGVGRFSDATDLDTFIEHLTRTLGHVDGEGHCEVSG